GEGLLALHGESHHERPRGRGHRPREDEPLALSRRRCGSACGELAAFRAEKTATHGKSERLAMSTQAMPIGGAKPSAGGEFHKAFIVAWLFCLLFYFMEYAMRSAPSVMLPELRTAFDLTPVGLSSLIGLYYYTYAGFAIITGAAVDRWGAKYTVPLGVLV